MSLERIKEICKDFKKALERLKEALNENFASENIVVDATIQRFEFSFELSWKLMRAVLNYNGIEAESPRVVVKEAFKLKIIQNGEDWIDMLEDRNKTSHIYDEKEALRIYKKIKKTHYKLLKHLENDIMKFVG